MPTVDHSLSFAQREGEAPLPQQLRLKELPQSIRARLWALIYEGLNESGDDWVEGRWAAVLRSYWIGELHRPIDELDLYREFVLRWLKPLILNGSYFNALGFVEHAIRTLAWASPGSPFAAAVDQQLRGGGAAYRVLDEQSIVPISTPEEATAVIESVSTLAAAGYQGARAHLHQAAAALSAGRHADAVRESIHAVESVARQIIPAADTLGPALNALEQQRHLHPAMKKGLASLYGYTSDEKGIRHALLDSGDAKVTEADALYMFGACAAFAAYLHRQAAQ